MKFQTAAFFASSVSASSLLACLIAMYSIQSNVQSIWQELDGEINEFKVFTLINFKIKI